MSTFPLRSKTARLALATGTALALSVMLAVPTGAETLDRNLNTKVAYAPANSAQAQSFSELEIVKAGHGFFGNTTKGVAQAVEYIFKKAGRPQGYIIGEEGAGAFVGGLRYGEGTLFLKNGTQKKVYWQGPSLGFDFGGNGSRTLVLVYNIDHTDDIFDRFYGLDGSAYLIGGVGVNFQSNEKLKLAPIRTGVGARLGANIGYLKYSARPTWNPF